MRGELIYVGGYPLYYRERADWPAPDPRTRKHPCEWMIRRFGESHVLACPQGPTTRIGYWGQYIWLCPEHGELVGDDGSMDDTYDTDAERAEALKRVGL